MIIIDPLKERLNRSIKLGGSPKNFALSAFGSPEDIRYLSNVEKNIQQNDRTYIYIDLTPPFSNITSYQTIIDVLNCMKKYRPVIMVRNEEFIKWAKHKNRTKSKLPVIIASFDNKGFNTGLFGGNDYDNQLKKSIKEDIKGKNIYGVQKSLIDIRRNYSEENLFNCLVRANCIEFPNYKKAKKYNYQVISNVGRLYQVLQNGMMVPCYLNLKYLGTNFQVLLDVVYEIFLNIENYFINDPVKEKDFSFIITTNNTALFIASLLQTIYEDKTLIPIDKLGPIPSLRLHSDQLRKKLKNQKILLFEEVVGTGSEVDRAIMFLNHMRAKIYKIIALYDLQVGRSLLINDTIEYDSLCTPKESLRYEYRSK